MDEASDGTKSAADKPLRARIADLIRTTLIEKALELFQREGYRATSVKSIAKAAGTTHTTFYKFFASKFQILLEAGYTTDDECQGMFARLGRINPKDVRSIRAWVEDYAQVWDRFQAIFEAHWEAAYGDPEMALMIFDATLRDAGAFRVGVEHAASVKDEDLTREVALIIMTTHPMLSAVMRIRDAQARSDMLDSIANILSRSLDRDGGW